MMILELIELTTFSFAELILVVSQLLVVSQGLTP